MSRKNYSDVLNSLLEKYKSENLEVPSNEATSNEVSSLRKDASADNSSETTKPNPEDDEKQTINIDLGPITVKQRAEFEDERDYLLNNSLEKQTLDEILKRLSGKQNLEAREYLLSALKHLFSFQLFLMNLVVILIAIWTIFDVPWFHKVDGLIYDRLCSFVTYYVSAVLVEMLGAIIFIVHKVFSKKYYD